MSNCDNFTKTKPVTKCGSRIWLGTNSSLTGDEQLFVKKVINGEEDIVLVDPIIEGDNIFLDPSDPYLDYYNPYFTFFIWLSDSNGYYSDGKLITNGGTEHNGFIVTFANVSGDRDRLITV